MLDLETCDLRSIGACVFDPTTGKVWTRLAGHATPEGDGTFYIATDNPLAKDVGAREGYNDGTNTIRLYDLWRDPETVQWWSDQSEEAQAAFTNPVDLCEALMKFGFWLMNIAPGQSLRLWSHGPAFDPPILAEAYHECGLEVPWHYRAPRDTRTLFDLAGISNHSEFMAQTSYGTAHHALDDAIAQARSVCAAWAIIRGWSDAASQLDGWGSK